MAGILIRKFGPSFEGAKGTLNISSAGSLSTTITPWPYRIVSQDGYIVAVSASLGTAPVGSAAVLDIVKTPSGGGSAVSIFADGQKLRIPAGSTTPVDGPDIDPGVDEVSEGDKISAVIESVGSESAGADLQLYVEIHPHRLEPKEATFVLGENTGDGPADLYVGTGVTNPVPVTRAGTPTRVTAVAAVAPVGADLIMNIQRTRGETTESIFGSGSKPTIPAASAALVAHQLRTFPPGFDLQPGDILTCDVIQVGSTTPGAGVTLKLEWRTR